MAANAMGGAAADAARPVLIETDNLITRSMVAADVTAELAEWFNHPQMLQGLNLPAQNFSLERLRAVVAAFDNRQHFLIGVFDRGDGRVLGFYNFSLEPAQRTALLTLGVSPHIHHGRAALWESWFPLCDEMFDHRGIDKITSRVLASNRRLLFAMMGTVHFVHEGTLRQELLGTDGQRADVLVLSCFKDAALRPRPRYTLWR